VALVRQILFQDQQLLMLAAVAVQDFQLLAQAGQAAAVLVTFLELVWQELQTQVEAEVAVVTLLTMVAQVVQALSSSLTLALKEAQAAQSQLQAVTPFTHSHHQALTLPNLIF
jgi:hypothetical protein